MARLEDTQKVFTTSGTILYLMRYTLRPSSRVSPVVLAEPRLQLTMASTRRAHIIEVRKWDIFFFDLVTDSVLAMIVRPMRLSAGTLVVGFRATRVRRVNRPWENSPVGNLRETF